MKSMGNALIAAVLVPAAAAAVANGADGSPEAAKAQQVLKSHCYRCHGQEGSVEGGMNFVLSASSLRSRKKVVPGSPQTSLLLKRMTSSDDPMPPADEKRRPSADEIAAVRAWIQAGAADFEAPAPPRSLMTIGLTFNYIKEDLGKISDRSRKFARYFTIGHLYNAGLSEDELQSYRNALSKLVNSLSWESEVVNPKPVDPAKTILRIDLRDYRWTPEIWNRLVAEYPFEVALTTAAFRTVTESTGTDLPVIRADWFVFAASRPPLYHELLQLPATAKELEKELKIDVQANIDGERVARSGFNGSGVSRNNRMIERHRINSGAYWKSYDFAGNGGKQNLFASPLGPGGGANGFRHDGGEIIFNLPNGLQAYMLVDGEGGRIDKGPISIVSDPKRPDRTVENGISCMSCHVRGTIDKTDQIREHVEKNPAAFSKTERESVLALYVPRAAFSALIKEDADRFSKAAAKTGAAPGVTEPIVALALRFEAELDLTAAAGEAGVAPTELLRAIDRAPPLGRSLGVLKSSGGTVQRQTFTENFAELVNELRIGSPIKTSGRPSAALMPGTDPLPPAGPGEAPAVHVAKLNATVAELVLSKDGRHLYLLNTSEGKVQRFDTGRRSFDDTAVAVADGTVAMAANPSVRALYTCSAGKVQVINPSTMKLTNTVAVPIEGVDLAADDRGMVYVSTKAAGVADRGISVVDPGRRSVVATYGTFYSNSILKLHPGGTKLYFGTTGVSPGDFHCIVIPTGKNRAVTYDSPYHGEHPLGGDFVISPDGNYLIAATGIVLRLARNQQDDLKFAAKVEQHSARVVDVKAKVLMCTTRDGSLKIYSYPGFDLKTSLTLPGVPYRMAWDAASKLLYCAIPLDKPKDENSIHWRVKREPADLHVFDLSTALNVK